MKRALAPVASLLLGVSILLTGQGLQVTLLPVRASLEDFSTVAIGIMGAAYFFGFTLGCLRGGELVSRVGHVRVFLAMTALGSSAPLVHGLFLSPVGWTILRMLTGYCFAVLYVVIESWLNERSTNENRGIVFATYVMISQFVLAVGQMMTLLYDPAGLQLFAIASVLVSLAAIPVALSTSPTPQQPQRHNVELSLRKLFRISPAATIGCLTSGLANGAFWSLAPVFAVAISHDTSLAAWFMSSTVVGGAVSQWPMGYMSDKWGRRSVMLILTVAGVAIAAMMVSSVDSLSFAAANLAGFAWGVVAFPLYTIAVAHANDYAQPDDYVMVSSGLLLMYGVGAILGPFIASTLMTLTSASALYAYIGFVHLCMACYIALRIARRESPPDEQHVAFGDALATAHTASQVYEEEIRNEAEEEAQ